MGDDKPVKELPAQSVGRPLLLGQDVEEKTRRVIQQIREAGGVINNSVVIGIITGILRDTESSLLLENGGPIHVDKSVARRLSSRMQFVKGRGTTKAKVTPSAFQSLQEQFLSNLRSVVMLEGWLTSWLSAVDNHITTHSF